MIVARPVAIPILAPRALPVPLARGVGARVPMIRAAVAIDVAAAVVVVAVVRRIGGDADRRAGDRAQGHALALAVADGGPGDGAQQTAQQGAFGLARAGQR